MRQEEIVVSKVKVYFGLSTISLLAGVVAHLLLMSLSSSDSNTWAEIKNTVSFSVLIVSIIGMATSVLTIKESRRKLFKYLCVAYILAFLIILVLGILTILVSGIGFLG